MVRFLQDIPSDRQGFFSAAQGNSKTDHIIDHKATLDKCRKTKGENKGGGQEERREGEFFVSCESTVEKKKNEILFKKKFDRS